MSDIVWENPPLGEGGRRDGRGTRFRELAVGMRAHPKRWAVIYTSTTPAAARSWVFRHNRGFGVLVFRDTADGVFEFACGGPTVYGRWIPAASS